jgi:hypothetical protein
LRPDGSDFRPKIFADFAIPLLAIRARFVLRTWIAAVLVSLCARKPAISHSVAPASASRVAPALRKPCADPSVMPAARHWERLINGFGCAKMAA